MIKTRIVLILTLVLYCIDLEAQSALRVEVDSIDNQIDKRFQVYVAPGFNVNQFVETGSSFICAYLGMIYENKIDFSVSYSWILDEFTKQIIFPGNHQYNQTNVGFDLQYSLLTKKIRPYIGVGFQIAKASWEPLSDSYDTFTDNINIFQANIGAKWLINPTFSLQANIGYKYPDEVELVGLTNEDYSGFKLDILLKIKLLSF